MPDLARKVIASYQDADREKYLDTLFRLHMIAGQYSDALSTLKSLRAVQKGSYSDVANIHPGFIDHGIL